jgi:uncharacterized cupin superfamily protein
MQLAATSAVAIKRRGWHATAMPRIDISAPAFHYDADDPEGFRVGMARLGPGLGAVETGTSIYELPPGQSICPYHYEHGEEEWLLVLAGTPTLRTPAGSEQIGPWELAFFPNGPEGAHRVQNDTGETVRVLMFSTRKPVAVAVYPDSDKIGIFTGTKADDIMVRRTSNVDYFDGEAGQDAEA